MPQVIHFFYVIGPNVSADSFGEILAFRTLQKQRAVSAPLFKGSTLRSSSVYSSGCFSLEDISKRKIMHHNEYYGTQQQA
jgi:hypothetical protein